jgi:hypothetical protein
MSWVDVTTAISTAGAAIVALGLGLRGIYLDRRRERDEELRQARLVMVSEPFLIDATAEHDRVVAVRVYNYSGEPIHDVSVSIDIWRDKGGGETPPDDSDGVSFDFLGPREEREILLDVPQEGLISVGSPELSFLDSSGRRFERRSTQAQPQRILRELRLAIQVVDGEPIIVALPHESRLKVIMRKVIPHPGNKLR